MLSLISLRFAQAALVLGVLVLAGWATGNDLLIRGFPGAIVMLPWTATGFVLGGGSLWIELRMHRGGRRFPVAIAAARGMATAVLAIGVVMGMQRFAGLDSSLNSILFPASLAELPYRPLGLMASNSTFCFTLLGVGLLASWSERWTSFREAVSASALLVAFLAVLGHLYGVSSLYSLDRYAGMAPITVLGFLLLSSALLLGGAEGGGARMLGDRRASSLVTRRLLPACLILPVLFGAIWLEARRADAVSREMGVSLFVVAIVVVFIGVLVWTARAIRKSEATREEALASAELASHNAIEAREIAETANRAKSEFLAVMSHELRTPLNAIRGYADLLDLEIDGPLTDLQRDRLARIQKSERHLLTLIDDLLTYTQMEGGRMKYELRDVSPRLVVDEAMQLTEARAKAKGIAVALNFERVGSGAVRADPERLLQIVVNLVANAIKFSDAGGTVSIICSETSGRDASGAMAIEVRDSGRGIPDDKLRDIFEPFFQVDKGLTRNSEGVGLGLAICRTLARAMDGEITVSSEPGKGSSFVVHVPLAIVRPASV